MDNGQVIYVDRVDGTTDVWDNSEAEVLFDSGMLQIYSSRKIVQDDGTQLVKTRAWYAHRQWIRFGEKPDDKLKQR